MPPNHNLRVGLATKLILCLVLSTIAFSGLFGWISMRLQKRRFEQMVTESAERIADLIERSARFSMERNDRLALYHLIREIGQEPGVDRLRIFNEEGFIRFSTDPAEVNHSVDKNAEACFACHAQQEPLVKLQRPDHARTFRVASGRRVLAVIRPIENRPACYNAACHAHPRQRRILGVIDTHLSLASVDAQLADHQHDLLLAILAGTGLICLSGGWFVWRFVHRPVRHLASATERVAEGRLEHRIEIDSADELGRLAESFNSMTGELQKAHSALEQWARTLEERVERKSQELRRAHDSLLASENLAALGKLAATVAHEVNNPLFGMLTCARLTLKELEHADLDPDRKSRVSQYLRVIERESKRCGDILRGLLEFARHGAAPTPPKLTESSINSLLERALGLVDHQLELQQIELDASLADGMPMLLCDPAQIEQALLAVLINAVEAMPSGGKLRLKTNFHPESGCCTVLIGDTGAGIAVENQEMIFEPFFTTKEFRHSTGLGLPIAKGIVERHGGKLEVESKPGEGAVFIFRLPLHVPGDKGESKCPSPSKAAY